MRLPLLLFLRGSALLRKSSRKAATPTHLLTATSSNASSSLAAPAVPCAVLLVGEGDFSYAADACRRRAEGGGSSVVGTAPSILATTLDSEAELKERYAKLLKRQKDRARREEVKAKRAWPPAFLTGI